MGTKEKTVRVKVFNRVLRVELDLPRGRYTQFEFVEPKDGWDIEFQDDVLEFEEGSRLVLDWPENSPLGTLSLCVERWYDYVYKKALWGKNIPLAVLQPSPTKGEPNIFWMYQTQPFKERKGNRKNKGVNNGIKRRSGKS